MEQEFLIIPDELLISKIYLFREKKVMFDRVPIAIGIAELYGIDTKRLNEQVNRNLDRFPEVPIAIGIMFQLDENEFLNLKSQIATSSSNFNKTTWGGRRKLPYVFTEHGVLMLSSVLNSKKAISVNIQLVRIFIKMRELLLTHKDILLVPIAIGIDSIRKTVNNQDERVEMIYNYLIKFIKQEQKPRTPIGF